MCTSGKLQSVPLKNSSPSFPTSTTNYPTKVLQHTEAHYTESLYRRSCAGWLKSSSLEFPPFASLIKADEGRTVSEPSPQAKLCLAFARLGRCGERFPSPSFHSAQHTRLIYFSLFFSFVVDALMLIRANGNGQMKENNNKKMLIQIFQKSSPGRGAFVSSQMRSGQSIITRRFKTERMMRFVPCFWASGEIISPQIFLFLHSHCTDQHAGRCSFV